jgi:hypothetical protein
MPNLITCGKPFVNALALAILSVRLLLKVSAGGGGL